MQICGKFRLSPGRGTSLRRELFLQLRSDGARACLGFVCTRERRVAMVSVEDLRASQNFESRQSSPSVSDLFLALSVSSEVAIEISR